MAPKTKGPKTKDYQVFVLYRLISFSVLLIFLFSFLSISIFSATRRHDWGAFVAVGMPVARHPRTIPYMRNYLIRLLSQVITPNRIKG